MESECQEQINQSQSVILEIGDSSAIAFDRVCRLCANSSEKVIGIYSEEGVSNDLGIKMNLYLPVKVADNDNLPLQCCWNCASTVLAWHELVVASVEADRRLRELQILSVKQITGDIKEEALVIPQDNNQLRRLAQEDFVNIQNNFRKIYINDYDVKLILKMVKTPEERRDNGVVDILNGSGVEYNCPHVNEGIQVALLTDTSSEHNSSGGNGKNNRLSNEFSNKCEICDKLLRSKGGLLAHLKLHTLDYNCPACCNSYISKFKLDEHMLTHSKVEFDSSKINPMKLPCKFANCDEQFSSKLRLHNHTKKHYDNTEYVCDICERAFVRRNNFEAHKKKHEMSFCCQLCDKSFANKKTMTEHERIHTGELPYECKICSEKFRCHSGLKYHETSHTNYKKYKCNRCEMTFARSSYLKVHLRKHLNEKPYACHYCPQRFIQLGILKRHVENLHRTCNLCNEMVGNLRDIRSHLWKKHPDYNKDLEKKNVKHTQSAASPH